MKKKILAILLTAAMITASGCNFKIGGDGGEKLTYNNLFTDAAADKGLVYTHSMVTYDYKLDNGYGAMKISVDTSDGHTFKMVEGQAAFDILDKDGKTVVHAVMTEPERYTAFTAEMSEEKTINGRKFFSIEDNAGQKCVASYMADCGINLGMLMFAEDYTSFRLVAFTGTPAEGSSADQYFYKGTKPAETTAAETLEETAATTEPAPETEGDAPIVTMEYIPEPDDTEITTDDNSFSYSVDMIDGLDRYYTVPDGAECTYSCEYFESFVFGEEQYTAMLFFERDYTIDQFMNGGTDDYLGLYKLSKKTELTTRFGKTAVVEAVGENATEYYVWCADSDIVSINFRNTYGDPLTEEQCIDIVKRFIG